MSDEPNLSEVVRTQDRHETKISFIEQHYVSEKVFLAMLGPISDRVLALEQADTSKTAGNRNWLLGLAQTVVGVALGVIAGILMKGGH
ncbi:MAG: hypothetical protein JWO67_2693 [Streptosporangiaceae bacterium]|nr:hypothetical protein [Streptosporangiaceae bacterium]